MSTRTHNPIGEQNSNEGKIYPEDYEWLGIIYQEDVKSKVAFITPLAFHEENTWYLVSKDMLSSYFPNNGKVATFFRDFYTAKVGQICYFRPEQNTQSSNLENHFHSLYMANRELAPFAQIFDWTSKAKESEDLPGILERGLPMSSCLSRIIYIRHQGMLYGPIKLEREAEQYKPYEYTHSNNNGGPALFVSVYNIPEENILTLDDGRNRFSVFDDSCLDSPIEQKDWSLPQVVIRRILRASSDVLIAAEGVRLTEHRIRELAHMSSRNGSFALQIEDSTLKRARVILKHQMEQLYGVKELIADLHADHPLVKAIREQEIQLRSVEIAQEAEKLIQVKKEELQQLDHSIQETREILNKLAEETETVEQRRDQALELEREIQNRIERLHEEPLRVLADLHIAASLLPLTRQSGLFMGEAHSQSHVASAIQANRIPQAQQQSSSEGMIKWIPNNSKEILSNNIQDLTGTFSVSFARQHDVNSDELKLCVSALLAGCIPSVNGFANASVLRAIALVIANERMWSVPVPLTALSPLDLFGKIDTEKCMFIPTAGNLADVILQAQQHPQELAIVLLEGIDRAPTIPVAVPLLRQYIQLRRNNTKPSPLSLFHPRAITPDDPYQKLAQFTWPTNILLAVTFDDDTASFLSPEILEHWLAHIDTHPKKSPTIQQANPAKPSIVSLSTWQEWTKPIRQKALKNIQSKRILEQRMLYEILTILKVENLSPNKVINEMWPLEDDDEDR